VSKCKFVKYLIIRRLDICDSTYRVEGIYDDYKKCLNDIDCLQKISSNQEYIFEIYCKGSGTQMGE
jgi:hypothetical protein